MGQAASSVQQHVNLAQHDAACDVNPSTRKLSETSNAAYKDDSSCIVGTVSRRIDPE